MVSFAVPLPSSTLQQLVVVDTADRLPACKQLVQRGTSGGQTEPGDLPRNSLAPPAARLDIACFFHVADIVVEVAVTTRPVESQCGQLRSSGIVYRCNGGM
jgi:hypothetical protein